MLPRKTPQAAREAGIPLTHLYSLLRTGKLAPPAKDSSGHYVWSDADVARIFQALAGDRRQPEELPANW
jgi:hypothetical protein